MPQLTIQQAFTLALRHHQAGQLQQAEKIYRQILGQEPRNADALHLLGVIAHQAGQNDRAVELIRQALALKPQYSEAYGNLGAALRGLGQLEAAIAACRQALALQPHDAVAHCNLGAALYDQGQGDAAIAAYRQALALNPNYPEAHYNLGVALMDQGQLAAAIAAYRQAIALQPQNPVTHNNLGNALKDQGQLDAASAAFRKALALNPNYAEAHYNLGTALHVMGQLDAAIAAYRQALALQPHLPQAHNNLGNALKDQGQLDAAIAAYRQALALDPGNARTHSNLVYTLHFHPAYDAQTIVGELRRWNLRHAEPLRQFIQPHAHDRTPERRLRVGYVSPDFRDHVVGRNLMPLFKHMDREQFEVVCYADVAVPDHLTEEFRRRAAGFHVVSTLSDAALAERIRADGIDILVDLALHIAGNRLPVFARKPAPVQVTFAGYPGTTGLGAIDYRLTDPFLDPPEPGVDEMYAEKSLRLPATFWCYDPLDDAPPAVSPLPALANGHVTFGCLNNFCKVNDGVLRLWAQVLAGVAGSRLVLLADEGSHRERTLVVLEGLGVSRQRVRFEAKRPRAEYLKLYQQIDLGLDTVPYNGHTTSLDSYFMGVPVVTLVGRTVVGRAGYSQLMNLGMPELIGRTEDQYMRIVGELASDLGRLASLRAALRGRMQASPLMDGAAFARGIEAAYRRMWRQ